MKPSGYGLDWHLGGQQAASSLESDLSDGEIVDPTVQGCHRGLPNMEPSVSLNQEQSSITNAARPDKIVCCDYSYCPSYSAIGSCAPELDTLGSNEAENFPINGSLVRFMQHPLFIS